MEFLNVGFETVQWLVDHQKLVSIRRSLLVRRPDKLKGTAFISNFDDLQDICLATADFYDCEEIGLAFNGYDVTTTDLSRDKNLPEELILKMRGEA